MPWPGAASLALLGQRLADALSLLGSCSGHTPALRRQGQVRVRARAVAGAARGQRGSPSPAVSSHVRRGIGHHFVREVSDPGGALPAFGTPSRAGHLPERGAGLPRHQRLRLPAVLLPSHRPAPSLPHQQVQTAAGDRGGLSTPLSQAGDHRVAQEPGAPPWVCASVRPLPHLSLRPLLIPGLFRSPCFHPCPPDFPFGRHFTLFPPIYLLTLVTPPFHLRPPSVPCESVTPTLDF